MTAIKELTAVERKGTGKGAARAVRRDKQIPAVIYGDKKAPITIALDQNTMNQRIFAGRFLTTIFDIDINGQKHRVIPKDVQFCPVKDTPLHIDFLRLGVGAKIKVWIPVHTLNAETSPGVKKGGTVNIVEHSIELFCPAEAIPSSIDIDLASMDIGDAVHLSQIKLPEGVKPVGHGDETVLTIVPPTIHEDKGSQAAAEGSTPATPAASA